MTAVPLNEVAGTSLFGGTVERLGRKVLGMSPPKDDKDNQPKTQINVTHKYYRTPVELSPKLRKKPYTYPDGTTKEQFTSSDVLEALFEVETLEIESHLGRAMTDGEYRVARNEFISSDLYSMDFLESVAAEMPSYIQEQIDILSSPGAAYFDTELVEAFLTEQYHIKPNRDPIVESVYHAISRTSRKGRE